MAIDVAKNIYGSDTFSILKTWYTVLKIVGYPYKAFTSSCRIFVMFGNPFYGTYLYFGILYKLPKAGVCSQQTKNTV